MIFRTKGSPDVFAYSLPRIKNTMLYEQYIKHQAVKSIYNIPNTTTNGQFYYNNIHAVISWY